MAHGSFTCVTWLIHMCAMTYSYVWHDSFIPDVEVRSMRVRWLIHMCDMTHSCVWHDSFMCVTWPDSFISVTWFVHMCNMTHPEVCHDSFMCVPWPTHTRRRSQKRKNVLAHTVQLFHNMWIWSVTGFFFGWIKESWKLVLFHNMWIWSVTMGWLQWVGSLKLQVSFAGYRLFYRALLQKRPIILSILLIVATP